MYTLDVKEKELEKLSPLPIRIQAVSIHYSKISTEATNSGVVVASVRQHNITKLCGYSERAIEIVISLKFERIMETSSCAVAIWEAGIDVWLDCYSTFFGKT